MKSRTDRVLDFLIILSLIALITGHLLNWGRSRSWNEPIFDYQSIDRT